MSRERGGHNDVFALKGKVLDIDEEKVISHCGRGIT